MSDELNRETGETQETAETGNDVVSSTESTALIGAGEISVDRPAAGETLTISAEKNTSYVLNFDPAEAQALVQGIDLVFLFENGAKIVFEGMAELAEGGDAPSLLLNGQDVLALLFGQQTIAGTTINKPAPGETVEYLYQNGESLNLNFDPASARVQVNGNHFILAFADGSSIVFLNLASLGIAQAPVFVMLDGGSFSSAALANLASVELQSPTYQSGGDGLGLDTIITAAENAPEGGGANDPGTIGNVIPLLDHEGVIPPTDLQFGLIDTINDEQFIPTTGPLADPVNTVAEFDNFPPELLSILTLFFGPGAATNGVNTGPCAPCEPIGMFDPEQIVLWETFTVDGSIGDDDAPPVDADYGGFDGETVLENLVFTITSLPQFGTLFLLVDGDPDNFVEATVGLPFDSNDQFLFVVVESQLNDISGDATWTYDVTDEDGNSASATVVVALPNADVTFAIQVESTDSSDDTPTQQATVSEEDSLGDNTATFTIFLGGDLLVPGNTASVQVVVSGTATDGTDLTPTVYDAIAAAVAGVTGVTFDAATGTLTYDHTAGDSFSFTLTAIEDNDFGELLESLVVTLTNPQVLFGTGFVVAGQEAAQVDIINDDTPTTGDNLVVQLDDDALAGGNPGGVGDDPDSVNASGTLAFDFGDDGAGSVAYLTTGAPAGFTYVASGTSLLIQQGGVTVLTLTLDPLTGAYTVTQNAPIDHVAGLNENNVVFTVGYLVSDSDDDTATGSITINVDDDTPVVSLAIAAGAMVIVDESLGENAGEDESASLGSVTVPAGVLFDVSSSVGADSDGATTVYSLQVNGGGATSLTTTNGLAITLVPISSTLVHGVAAGGGIAFTVSIDAVTGAVTLTQLLSLTHPDSPNNFDESVALDLGVLDAVLTATDGDGDVASDTADLGGNVIKFEDDGPTADITLAGDMVTHDETAGQQGDDTVSAAVVALFAGVANVGTDLTPTGYATSGGAVVSDGSDPGQDDEGATSAFSLSVVNGTNSGLMTTDGMAIFLFLESGLIVGRVGGAGGEAAFAIAIDANTGVVSVAQYISLFHPIPGDPNEIVDLSGAGVLAVVTITDGDLDQDTDAIDIGALIKFADDAPTIGNSTPATIDEDDLPGGNDNSDPDLMTVVGNLGTGGIDFGEDGPGGGAGTSVVGPLGITSMGLAVTYVFVDNGNGTGTLTASAGGTTVFTVDVDFIAGTYSFTLEDKLDHPAVGEDILQLDFGFDATDGDGDPVGGAFTVFVIDDIPIAGIALAGDMVTHDETSGLQGDDTNNAAVVALFAGVANVGTDLTPTGYATSGGAVVTSNSSPGADGLASEAFSLSVVNGANSGLTTTDGMAIFLFLENGLIVGRVGGAGGEAAFAVAIDATTGVVSVAQYVSLFQPNAADPNDIVNLGGAGVLAVVTITDGDGDQDTDSVDIGALIKFADDGPTAAITLTGTMVVHDETVGQQDDDTTDVGVIALFAGVTDPGTDLGTGGLPGYAESNGAVVVTTGSDFGADDENTMTAISLSLLVAPGTDSGLDTTDGQSIFLFLEGGLIVGRVGGALGDAAFAIAIDANGVVSIAQYLSLDHPLGGTAISGLHDDTLILGMGLVAADVTVTDGDGDTDTASVDIGNQIKFDDDGPNAMIDTTGTMVVHDESVGQQDDDTTDVGVIALFAGVANPGADAGTGGLPGYAESNGAVVTSAGTTFGADEENGTTAFSLSVVDGTDSGLDTTDGQSIFLFLENGLIVGRVGGAGGDAAFAIAIDANTGVLSIAQYLSLNHPLSGDLASGLHDDTLSLGLGLVSAVVTVTDGDGDTDEAGVDIGDMIKFDDDGPTLVAGQSLGTVEEEQLAGGIDDDTGTPAQDLDAGGNFNLTTDVAMGSLSGLVDFGADEEGASFSFSSDTSSLTSQGLTSGTVGLTYTVNPAGTLITAMAGVTPIFTLSLNATGTWTFTLLGVLDHAADDMEDLLDIDFTAMVVAADGDGDTVALSADSFVVTVIDDIPTDYTPDAAIVANSGDGLATEPLNTAGHIGADGLRSVLFTGVTDGDFLMGSIGGAIDDVLQSGGNDIQLDINLAETVITAFVDGNGDNVFGDPTDELIFTATLNGDGTYTIDMVGTIDNGGGEDFDDFTQVSAGLQLWTGVNGSLLDILLTAGDANTDTANTSTQGFGVNNNLINSPTAMDPTGDIARIDFVSGLNLVPAGGQSFNDFLGNLSNVSFTQHESVNGGRVQISGITGGGLVDVRLYAYDADDGMGFAQNVAGDYDGDPDDLPLNDIIGSEIIVLAADGVTDVTAMVTIVDNGDGTVDILGLDNDWTITQINSADGDFNRLEVENIDTEGNDFRITEVGFAFSVFGDPINFDFDTELTDNDGDTSLGTIDVTVLPQIDGTAGADPALIGTTGDEFIVGGLGNDVMTGDDGGDIFVFEADVNEGSDQILDFNFSEGDRLSFLDVVDTMGPAGVDVMDLIAGYVDGGAPNAIDTITLVNGTVIAVTDEDDAFQSDADVFNNSIINGA